MIVQIQTSMELTDLIENNDAVVVSYTAPTWCVPCRQFKPHFLQASLRMTDVVFVEVDMGASPEDTGMHWATQAYNIRGVPTVCLYTTRDSLDAPYVVRERSLVPFMKEVEANRK